MWLDHKTNLGSSINLSLPRVLSLTEHRRSHDLVAILAADEIRCFEEYRGAIRPRHTLPFGFRSERPIDGGGDGRGVRFVISAEMVGVVVWQRLFRELARLDLYQY